MSLLPVVAVVVPVLLVAFTLPVVEVLVVTGLTREPLVGVLARRHK